MRINRERNETDVKKGMMGYNVLIISWNIVAIWLNIIARGQGVSLVDLMRIS